jgi:hypothetical protein
MTSVLTYWLATNAGAAIPRTCGAFQVSKEFSAIGSSTGTAGGDFGGCFDLPDFLVFLRRSLLVAFRTFFTCLVFLRFFVAICLTPSYRRGMY